MNPLRTNRSCHRRDAHWCTKYTEATSNNSSGSAKGVCTPTTSRTSYRRIMRAVLIRTALDHGVKVYECTLTPQSLLQADELFLTNAVRGIEWVASYKTKRYFHSMAEKLTPWITDDLPST